MKHLSILLSISIVLTLFAGCVPADTPPQLEFTPGPEFQITTTDYTNQTYTFAYPVNWRVISGPVDSAGQVILVAPDDDALIVLNTSPVDALPTIDGLADVQSRYVEIEAPSVHAYLVTSGALFPTFEPVFEQVISTLKHP